MPPVRWKDLCVTTLLQMIVIVSSSSMQDPITMSSDGWRPIVGSRRLPPGFETDLRVSNNKIPNRNVEIETIKSESPITITTADPEQIEIESSTRPWNGQNPNKGSKVPPHSKFSSMKYQTLPPNSISLGRPSQYGLRKLPLQANPVKTAPHLMHSPKRKPVANKGQLGAHSTKNEIYIHPSGSVTYPYLQQTINNVRTRETQGLGLFGNQNHFTVNQPNSHVEINRFPSLNDNIFEQYRSPGVTFHLPQFKNGQDEFSRNLVPPPPSRNLAAEKEKLKNSKIPKFKDNTGTNSDAVVKTHGEFGIRPPLIQENLVQIPVNYDQNFALQKPTKQQPVDIQVTKESIKVFHNIYQDNRHKPHNADYLDYDYHGLSTTGQLPKLQTYEVTEGKGQDSPNPYTFTYLKPQEVAQSIQTIRQQAVPPQITNEPVVELNLPPFLPTPFKPDPIYPTSSTQAEASTVFSLVSKKMNKFKNEALNNNPVFFDVKEVSTHYPILGRPTFIHEEQTDNPVKENEIIINEVTTQREEITTKKRRRRPQPRKPTTTTEEYPTVNNYEEVRIQEDTTPVTEPLPPKRLRQRPKEETPPATEQSPPKRLRQKPKEETSPLTEQVPPKRLRQKPTEETSPLTEQVPPKRLRQKPYRNRLPSDSKPLLVNATPADDNEEISTERNLRGRNKLRQKGSENKIHNELRNSSHRKRARPTTTEVAINHKMVDNSDQVENEESKYYLKAETYTTTKPHRMTENEGNSMSEEDKSEGSYETTPSSNSFEDILKDEKTTTPIDETTYLPNILSPENEIDSTTISQHVQINQEQAIETTTFPITTTTETKTTSKTIRNKSRSPNYKSSNRPRFSVKDYRQRLNQLAASSTTPTTTDIVDTASEVSRIRFPARLRTRPSQTSTTSQSPPPEETTTEFIVRRRFKPKEPRYASTTEANNIIPETRVKSVNTRLRPFDRYKTSTEASLKSKISINPNLYVGKRKSLLSMRSRLIEKENKTEETTTTETARKTEEEKEDVEVTTEYQSVKITTTDSPQITTVDINEDDYSQRVSDLTSSFKSEYETPGLFKNVAPVSRRVPNYFTISTEDPILPIEAFFPGINDKES